MPKAQVSMTQEYTNWIHEMDNTKAECLKHNEKDDVPYPMKMEIWQTGWNPTSNADTHCFESTSLNGTDEINKYDI